MERKDIYGSLVVQTLDGSATSNKVSCAGRFVVFWQNKVNGHKDEPDALLSICLY